jgi:RHS repeat-associated protein
LYYSYSGNRIVGVDDYVASYQGFKDNGHYYISTGVVEYSYDANGNLTRDLNKGIISILYNHLNLPYKIELENNRRIYYIYDANGTKLRKYYYEDNRLMETTDYSGMFIYKDDHLDYILTPEGRLKWDDHINQFYAEYFIKDHLGNVRSVITSDPHLHYIVQGTDYYPFGQEIPVLGASDNQIKYNSKELQTDAGLNWYDYGARFYDPVLGRFNSIDPKTEEYNSWSPYLYAGNNPINYIDLNGEGPGNDLIALLIYSTIAVRSWFGGMVSYTEQSSQNGTYNSMNMVDANNQGLGSQKIVSDLSQIINQVQEDVQETIDVRIGVGVDFNPTKDENVAISTGAEVGTDGGKVYVSSPGETSIEGSTDLNGNVSGNITLLGGSVAGQQKDEGKTSFQTSSNGAYIKAVVDDSKVLPNLINLKGTVSEFLETHTSTITNNDKKEN